mmetsp:Transcript_37623/g.92482  ORF Transcript_37623/g.92482 Transcript_37623/m.92482 type:complete len:143 (-) Transcript_37623:108-536(-)|eukprot:CAMPEP_0206237954 /NCGR_PEP_ID=MMETSP0047_2-20121206/14550_1 /ASSEMBLY_ACC=CAM_ASM_000192 /TAXON_ID=195065 /ORGANISM="Chroomonas mesostigmatica_cf, Strain CCMP1168" /LENGTH=142 /DNA_ID=CAMNT_0053662443 /DNA_START=39 /DNA_END=467 /DNA_ORIENTATION=+
MSDKKLFQQLAEFMATSGFQNKLFKFLNEDCAELQIKPEGEEQSIQAYTVYQRYTTMFEGEFTDFMTQIGASSMEEMQEKLESEMSTDSQGQKFYLGLLASMEYNKFCQLVKDFQEADDDEWDEDGDEDDDGEEAFGAVSPE